MPKTAETPAKKASVKKAAPAKEAAEPKKERAPREPKDLSPNMIRVLEALKGGDIMTASALAEATGIAKGKRIPELVEKGYLTELVPEEGIRGKRFKLTAPGRKALEKALKEEAAKS